MLMSSEAEPTTLQAAQTLAYQARSFITSGLFLFCVPRQHELTVLCCLRSFWWE